MNLKSNVLAEVERFGREIHPGATPDLRFAEESLLRNLTEIANRIERLRNDLSVSTIAAVADITRSVGASGPVGSLWEKVVADAVRIDAITRFALVPLEEA